MNEWEQGLNFTIGVNFVILLYRPTVPYISLWVQFMCVCVCVKTSGQWLKWKHARIALKISLKSQILKIWSVSFIVFFFILKMKVIPMLNVSKLFSSWSKLNIWFYSRTQNPGSQQQGRMECSPKTYTFSISSYMNFAEGFNIVS